MNIHILNLFNKTVREHAHAVAYLVEWSSPTGDRQEYLLYDRTEWGAQYSVKQALGNDPSRWPAWVKITNLSENKNVEVQYDDEPIDQDEPF